MNGAPLDEVRKLLDKGLRERFFEEHADAIRDALREPKPGQSQDPTAGLEERVGKVPPSDQVRGFLRGLEEAVPRKMRPIVVARSLQEMDSRFERLAGLEEQGIYLHRAGDEVGLMIRITERDADGFVLAGLEEEARSMKPFADPLKLRVELLTTGQRRFQEMVVALLSQATGLEEAAIQARAGSRAGSGQ